MNPQDSLLLFRDLHQHAALIEYLGLIALSFTLYKLWRSKSKKPNLPPSPPKLPVIGNLHQLGSFPHRNLRSLSNKYGPLMLFHFGRVPTIIVSSATMAREVMKTHDLSFSSRPSSSIFSTISYNHKDVAFAPYGEYWRQVRRICVLHLLSPKRVQSFRHVREEEIAVMIEKIRSSSDSGPIDLSEIMNKLTHDIVCRVALGRKYSSKEGEGSRVRELLGELGALLGEFPVGEFIPGFSWFDRWRGLDARVMKNFNEFDTFINKVVEDVVLVAPPNTLGIEEDPERDGGPRGGLCCSTRGAGPAAAGLALGAAAAARQASPHVLLQWGGCSRLEMKAGRSRLSAPPFCL